MRSVTAEPIVNWSLGKHSPRNFLSALSTIQFCLCGPPISSPVILLAAVAQGVESADTSLPENVSCTLYRMSGQAELFEIWFSGFNGRCIEGM